MNKVRTWFLILISFSMLSQDCFGFFFRHRRAGFRRPFIVRPIFRRRFYRPFFFRPFYRRRFVRAPFAGACRSCGFPMQRRHFRQPVVVQRPRFAQPRHFGNLQAAPFIDSSGGQGQFVGSVQQPLSSTPPTGVAGGSDLDFARSPLKNPNEFAFADSPQLNNLLETTPNQGGVTKVIQSNGPGQSPEVRFLQNGQVVYFRGDLRSNVARTVFQDPNTGQWRISSGAVQFNNTPQFVVSPPPVQRVQPPSGGC